VRKFHTLPELAIFFPKFRLGSPVSKWERVNLADLPSPDWSWAHLMRRTFGFDLLRCEKCGGQRRVISTITQTPVIEKILSAMGIETMDCEASPARAPPEQRCWA
jgi:hypothetical protein